MSDKSNQAPQQPDKGNINKTAEESIQTTDARPPSNTTPTVAGEMPTADHQQVAIRAQQSRSKTRDDHGINAATITPEFNAAVVPPPIPPEPATLDTPDGGITPVFNEAANPPRVPGEAKPQYNYDPPVPGGPAPGGQATPPVSPPLRTEDEKANDFKKRMRVRREFNEKARDGFERDR